MYDYKITCEKCNGRVFSLQITPHSRLYFARCQTTDCDGLMLIGGNDVMDYTIDDERLHRRSILFRRFS